MKPQEKLRQMYARACETMPEATDEDNPPICTDATRVNSVNGDTWYEVSFVNFKLTAAARRKTEAMLSNEFGVEVRINI
jgi:hypothetical protein